LLCDIGIHPMALAHYPKLQDQETLRRIGERIGEENAQNRLLPDLVTAH
jgi:hypothetical protein